jgi:O-6-methylguanine DNA methyltransferase
VASLLRLDEGDLSRLAAAPARRGATPAAAARPNGVAGRSSALYGYAAFPLRFGTFYVAFGPGGPAFARIATSAAAFELEATRYLGAPVRSGPAPGWLTGAVSAAVRAHEAFRGPVDLARVGPFEREVLAELRRIPAGQVRTYQQVALALGEPGGARAVGAACARNPLPLLIPCHRVVRTDGGLGGYSLRGGVELKRRLLRDEGALTGLFA